MNEVRCHVILYAWLIGKEPTRAEYPVQMVGFGQAVSLVRWLLMLDAPFIRNWTASASLLFKSKLEGRMYRWKWTGFEWMCVCASSLYTSCLTLSQSINSVAVLHLFSQSLPAQHKPSNRIIATHIFFLLSKTSWGFLWKPGEALCNFIHMFSGRLCRMVLGLAWRVQLLIVASLPELLECEWGSPPSLNVCWIMPF